jgi:hypothetical protein
MRSGTGGDASRPSWVDETGRLSLKELDIGMDLPMLSEAAVHFFGLFSQPTDNSDFSAMADTKEETKGEHINLKVKGQVRRLWTCHNGLRFMPRL